MVQKGKCITNLIIVLKECFGIVKRELVTYLNVMSIAPLLP